MSEIVPVDSGLRQSTWPFQKPIAEAQRDRKMMNLCWSLEQFVQIGKNYKNNEYN